MASNIDVINPDGVSGTIPEEDLQNALKAGYTTKEAGPPEIKPVEKYTGGLDQPTGREVLPAMSEHQNDIIHVISPEGIKGTIPFDDLQAARKQGYVPQEEQDVKEQGGLGIGKLSKPLDAAAYGLLNNTLGSEEKPLEETGTLPSSILKEQNPISYYTGAVVGNVVSGGALGKVAGAATKAIGLSGITKVAAEGVIYNADEIAKSVINKDPVGTAEAVVLGGLTNVGIHGVFAGGKALVGAAEDIAGGLGGEAASSQEAREKSINLAAKALGASPSAIAKIGDDFPGIIKAAKISTTDSVEEMIKKVQNLSESGPAIGKAIKALDEAPSKGVFISDNLTKAVDEIKALHPDAFPEGTNLKTKRLPNLDPMAQEARDALSPILEQLESTADKGTYSDTQRAEKWVGGRISGDDNGSVNSLKKQAAVITRKYKMLAEDEGANELIKAGTAGASDIVSGLQEQRAAYSAYKLFGDIADRQAAKQLPENFLQDFIGMHAAHRSLPILALHLAGVPGPIALAGGVALPYVKKKLANRALSQAIGNILADDTKPIAQTLVQAVEDQDKQIAKSSKDLLDSFSSVAKPLAVAKAAGGLQDWLANKNQEGSDKDHLDTLRKAVNDASNNPKTFADNMAPVTDKMQKEGFHEVAEAYNQHQLRLLKVLQAVLPADTSMANAHPFSANVDVSEISQAAKDKYENALKIAADPLALLEKIKSNSITPMDVAIAAATNPTTLQKMRNALVDEALKSKPDLSYQHQLSMEIMMATNIDDSTQQLPVLQSVFGTPPPIGTGGSSGSGKKTSNKSLSKVADPYKTSVDRAAVL